MLLKKMFLLIVVIGFACSHPPNVKAQHKEVSWVVEKNSTLYVAGRSNINSFTCSINKYGKVDTIHLWGSNASSVRLSGDLQMNISAFDCHNMLITRDLRKTLKSEEYPILNIRFLSLACMPMFKSDCEYINGRVEVELAGITRQFEIKYTFTKKNVATIQLDGNSNFCFSDFKLSPPRKLAGLVRIEDDFEVNFSLTLRNIKP